MRTQCHGTPPLIGGEREGVGCEGCHNPGGNGSPITRTIPNPSITANQSVWGWRTSRETRRRGSRSAPTATCWMGSRRTHALTGDGHPDGRRWNVGAKYAGVSKHWKPETAALYTAEKVVARARVDRGTGGAAETEAKGEEPKPKGEEPKPKGAEAKPKPDEPKPKAEEPKESRRAKGEAGAEGKAGGTKPTAEPPPPPPADPGPRPSMMRGSVFRYPCRRRRRQPRLKSRGAAEPRRRISDPPVERRDARTAAQSIASAGADLEPRRAELPVTCGHPRQLPFDGRTNSTA